MKRNKNIACLQGGYLFPEISRRREKFVSENPDSAVISLGIGDTTLPIGKYISGVMSDYARDLATKDGYSGYGSEQGLPALREKIIDVFYDGIIDADEIFVSDGSKCDIGRLQVLFGGDTSVAVQDPSYPVYVDGSVIIGCGGEYDENKSGYSKIEYMPCTEKNGFLPDLSSVSKTDLIYICSPNNPTGAVAGRDWLKKLVDFAITNKSIIIFDTAYSKYISDSDLPKSIFEIDGAKKCAIETNSFSKIAGFTGVRLGWTVVPHELVYDGGEKVHADWNRLTGTVFNAASNISQKGGLACLDEQGLKEIDETVAYYKENAKIIKNALNFFGIKSFGGKNSPYIWAKFPGQSSWDVFEKLLQQYQIITTPGSGFGPAGEGFIRFSSFGKREDVIEAVNRVKKDPPIL